MAVQTKKSDYRIEENVQGFIVQKRFEEKVQTGFFRKTTIIEHWKNLDENGSTIFLYSGNSKKIYTTIKKAKLAIEKFKTKPIYHY